MDWLKASSNAYNVDIKKSLYFPSRLSYWILIKKKIN